MICFTINAVRTATVILFAATLVSCGGGGGGDSGGGSGGSSYQGIVTSVPTPTYTADSLQIWNLLSSIRLGAGSGLVAQNSTLDTSASSHANFLISNGLVSNSTYLATYHGGILGGHYEDASRLGYAGTTPQARATTSGYSGTVTELIVVGASSGTECLASLENSVYHMIYFLMPSVDVGINFNPGTGGGSVCAVEMGIERDTLGQLPASGKLVFYPYDGQTAVLPVFYNHAEMPVPASDIALAGHPIAVSLHTLSVPTLNGGEISINRFSINDGGGVPLAARLLVANSAVKSSSLVLTVDSNISDAGYVVLLPIMPLAANTTYSVVFDATVNDQVVNKIWSFTTGNVN